MLLQLFSFVNFNNAMAFVYAYICRIPDRNLGRSGICLGQIGILFWPRQIPDLPKVILGQIRIPIWLGRF